MHRFYSPVQLYAQLLLFLETGIHRYLGRTTGIQKLHEGVFIVTSDKVFDFLREKASKVEKRREKVPKVTLLDIYHYRFGNGMRTNLLAQWMRLE